MDGRAKKSQLQEAGGSAGKVDGSDLTLVQVWLSVEGLAPRISARTLTGSGLASLHASAHGELRHSLGQLHLPSRSNLQILDARRGALTSECEQIPPHKVGPSSFVLHPVRRTRCSRDLVYCIGPNWSGPPALTTHLRFLTSGIV